MVGALDRAAHGFNRFNKGIDRVSGAVLNITITAIFVIIVVSVFFRYVLGNAIHWSEEVAKFILVYMCFIGASTVMIRGGHVGIQFFYDRAQGAAKVVLVLFSEFVVLATLAMLVYYGFDITLTAIPQRSTAVPWLSLGVIYVCMPLGALMMIPISIELMLKNLADSLRKLH